MKSNKKVDENLILNNIFRENFFKFLREHGFGEEELIVVFDIKRMSSQEQNKFNIALRVVCNKYGISLTECIIFLEEKYIKFKKILSILDDDTKFLLKKELSKKYNIKLQENNLIDILDY